MLRNNLIVLLTVLHAFGIENKNFAINNICPMLQKFELPIGRNHQSPQTDEMYHLHKPKIWTENGVLFMARIKQK